MFVKIQCKRRKPTPFVASSFVLHGTGDNLFNCGNLQVTVLDIDFPPFSLSSLFFNTFGDESEAIHSICPWRFFHGFSEKFM